MQGNELFPDKLRIVRYNLADLHIHSFCSDGVRTPRRAVEEANAAGLQALSLTDHDTVAGIDEANQAGSELNIEVVPGTEFSAHVGHREVHILAYCFEWKDPRLLEHVGKLYQKRHERGVAIVERLNQLGIEMTVDQVLEAADGSPLGRPHIAATMVENGVVTSKEEAFDRYLGDRSPAFVPKPHISARGVIDLVHSVGGVAFLAHPGLSLQEATIVELVKNGLDGIEVYHPGHQPVHIDYYTQLVLDHNLLQTGGSDSHGWDTGARIGDYGIGYEAVEAMRQRAAMYS